MSLFIPLLDTGGADADRDRISRFLTGLFDGMSAERRVALISVIILASVVIRAVLRLTCDVLFARVYTTAGHLARTGVHEQLITVDQSWLQQTEQGRLLNALSKGSWDVAEGVGMVVRMLILLMNVFAYVTLLMLIDWKLTIIVGVTLVIISGIVRYLTRRVTEHSTSVAAQNGVLATRAVEDTAGAKLLRAFGREDYARALFHQGSMRLSGLYRKMYMSRALVNPVYELSASVIVVLAIYGVRDEPARLPSLLVFLLLLYRLQPIAKEFDIHWVSVRQLHGSVVDVVSLLDPSDKPRMADGPRDATELGPGLSLRDVSFRYTAGEELALDDVTVAFPAHKTTAVVGPSGAGKSTMIDLVQRLIDPTEGEVLLDGVPLTELRIASVRKRMAYVSQQVQLFNGTVQDNIRFGRPDATDEQVHQAAARANATAFIEQLPEGFETQLGDDGGRLSGGERQRLALARAIIREPEILILDEATNALDSISEHLVQEAIDELSEGRTVIVIAHRLATVRRADQVICVEGGRVVEVGPPDVLLKQGGLFTRLNELQRTFEVRPS